MHKRESKIFTTSDIFFEGNFAMHSACILIVWIDFCLTFQVHYGIDNNKLISWKHVKWVLESEIFQLILLIKYNNNKLCYNISPLHNHQQCNFYLFATPHMNVFNQTEIMRFGMLHDLNDVQIYYLIFFWQTRDDRRIPFRWWVLTRLSSRIIPSTKFSFDSLINNFSYFVS